MPFKIDDHAMFVAAGRMLKDAAGGDPYVSQQDQRVLPQYAQDRLDEQRAKKANTRIRWYSQAQSWVVDPPVRDAWDSVRGHGQDGYWLAKSELNQIENPEIRDFSMKLWDLVAERIRNGQST